MAEHCHPKLEIYLYAATENAYEAEDQDTIIVYVSSVTVPSKPLLCTLRANRVSQACVQKVQPSFTLVHCIASKCPERLNWKEQTSLPE